MSIPMERLPIAEKVSGDDYLVGNQGTPPVTRLLKLSKVFTATDASVGAVGTYPTLRGPTKIEDLQVASTVYTNDVLFVNQGLPAVTGKITVADLLAAAATTTASNTEFDINLVPQDKLVSELVTRLTVSLTDWTIINQGDPPVTRRVLVFLLVGSINVVLREDFSFVFREDLGYVVREV